MISLRLASDIDVNGNETVAVRRAYRQARDGSLSVVGVGEEDSVVELGKGLVRRLHANEADDLRQRVRRSCTCKGRC